MLSSKLLNLSCLRYINFLSIAIAFSLFIPQNVNSAELAEIKARGSLIVGIAYYLMSYSYSLSIG